MATAEPSQSVWIKLYLNENDQNPSVFKIKDFEGDIDDLKKKIKEENPNDLSSVDAARLNIYPPGTVVPSKAKPIEPYENNLSENTGKNPLIVVARVDSLATRYKALEQDSSAGRP